MTQSVPWWQLTPTENSRITDQERGAGITRVTPREPPHLQGPARDPSK